MSDILTLQSGSGLAVYWCVLVHTARLSYSLKTLNQLNYGTAGLSPTFLLSDSQWKGPACFPCDTFQIKFHLRSLNLMGLKILTALYQQHTADLSVFEWDVL